jgi:signal transduction histidine kinase
MLSFSKSAIRTLIGYCESVSDTSSPAEILPMLVDAVITQGGADAAAAFKVNGQAELQQVVAQNLCDAAMEVKVELATIGDELAKSLLDASGGVFANAHTFPFINDGQLFGALVVLFKPTTALSESQFSILEQLVHFAAIALRKADQYANLQKAYCDLQTSQELLFRTGKLRALGEMSAGISHDLKNILSPLRIYVKVLNRVKDDPEAIADVAKRLDMSLKRGVDVVDRLRDFSRQAPEQQEAQVADLNHLVREAVEIARPRLSGIGLITELGNPGSVRINVSDFVAAVVNLIFNAIEAMQSRGTIWVRSGEASNGGWVQIVDSGPGIAPEIRERILEPFFTTKGKEGTGLGLSMVYAFTQRYQGKLSIDSEPGSGMTFTMWFPSA